MSITFYYAANWFLECVQANHNGVQGVLSNLCKPCWLVWFDCIMMQSYTLLLILVLFTITLLQ